MKQDGLSFETAIIITASNESEGVRAEYEWLEQQYPGYTATRQKLRSSDSIRYDIIEIETIDGQNLSIYFNINSFFGK